MYFLSSKGRTICLTDIVCWNLRQEVKRWGLMQVPVDHETLFIVCHVGTHVCIFIHDDLLEPLDLRFLV